MALEHALNHEQTGPGLFPVVASVLRDDKGSNTAFCQCGYECESGACCCAYETSELACDQKQKGRRSASGSYQISASSIESRPGAESESCHWPLPALAQAAALSWEAEFSARAEPATTLVSQRSTSAFSKWRMEWRICTKGSHLYCSRLMVGKQTLKAKKRLTLEGQKSVSAASRC